MAALARMNPVDGPLGLPVLAANALTPGGAGRVIGPGAEARLGRRGFAAAVLAGAALMLCAMAGCTGPEKDPPTSTHANVKINGKTFKLELALDPQKRFRGLSERTEIPESGGMLFVFPDDQVGVHNFVMRDCPIDIDIIYLDGSGRIQAFHEMKKEPPRGPDEGRPGDDSPKYEARLKKYSSRFPSQFAIELRGGTIPGLKLQQGQKVELDAEGLKKRAK
jgi:uncharacterized membrane protein (UPF0127 family)